MNNIYCVNWWVPFPSSEYGGILDFYNFVEYIENKWSVMSHNGFNEFDPIGTTHLPSGVIKSFIT